ncbi:hypothetical protein OAM69_02750 [bacterium]|nr:hypothetical protein [bacterium]
MNEFKTTQDVLFTLTPHQINVLRNRFGMDGAAVNPLDDSAVPPLSNDEDDGSGESAPAAPQSD